MAVMSVDSINAPSANPFSKADPVPVTVEKSEPKPKPIPKVEVVGELPPFTMEEKSCRSCGYYSFPDDGDRRLAAEGECRRHAPTPGNQSLACWPVVPWKGWCGEWENGVSNEDMVRMARDIGENLVQEEF